MANSFEPGTKIKWYDSKRGNKTGVVVGPSRQGSDCVIVEWDCENFPTLSVENVDDLEECPIEEGRGTYTFSINPANSLYPNSNWVVADSAQQAAEHAALRFVKNEKNGQVHEITVISPRKFKHEFKVKVTAEIISHKRSK